MKKDYFAHETAVIDDGCEIGNGTKIWHFSHIMKNSKLGEKCNVGQNVVISPGVVLGKNVKVQNNVSIYTGVICEDDVFLGPSMVFTNIKNPRSAVIRRDQYVTTLVKKGATIGANSTIICGITLGEFSFIGAGAVVSKDVAPYSLVIGNPARHIGWMSEFGHRLKFDKNNIAVCPESEKRYIIEDDRVRKID
jgi:UDP-2-acetamido-3-amino-2,3-dideoxy-glucuronate N-acetyltransferase